ncbi:uncharacterized protein LOC143073799 [Mytilus galloprovincialis]|uniref:uncharacterized protein LOC143073799 n=1 Tax=Mytilus galloprovincialis TaxID=29158 RepID=UPI003F7C068C
MEHLHNFNGVPIWIICVLILYINLTSAADPECIGSTSPLGMQSGNITAEQITYSSLRTDLKKEYSRYDCCQGATFAAWCPATQTIGEWIEVSFEEPTILSSIKIQKPLGSNTKWPTELDILIEEAQSSPGNLTDSGETIKLVPSNGDETLTLQNPVAVRRVRLVIANFTEEPCFRFEINGCPVKDPDPPEVPDLPDLEFTYNSPDDLQLKCSFGTTFSYGVQYDVTWEDNGKILSQKLLPNTEVSDILHFTSTVLDLISKIKCTVKACNKNDCPTLFGTKKASNIFRPEIQIKNGTSLTVREGGEESFVVITSNVPPVVYCRAQSLDDDCTVFVQLRSNEQNPVLCKNGHDITQVVFPEEGGETKSCTVTVTSDNWDKDIHVPVKAAMDGIIDGMKTVTVTLTTKVENVAMITNVKSVQSTKL